jgi:hypothetical protein
MSGTVSRVGCAHSDPLAVLTLLARPVPHRVGLGSEWSLQLFLEG